ncbi:MAG: glycosyltransferase [Bacteroidales bacterium]|nr:glycosyltransferase [Bacteroidales bacterium]
MLVSIIVPVFKVEPYLKQCLDSIVNQTYKNLEIILVDDGSPDNCPKICDDFARADNRIIVIHKKNEGLSEARNAGTKIATGAYIYFVDSDDYISNQVIQNFVEIAEKKQADIIIGNHKSFFNDFAHCKETVCLFKENSLLEIMHKYLYPNKHYLQCVVAWNKLVKSEIAKKYPFPKGKLIEDNFTTYKYYNAAKKIYITEQPTYFYRQRNSGIMGFVKKNPQIIAETQIEYIKERIAFFKEQGKPSIANIFLPLYIRFFLYGTFVKECQSTSVNVSLKEIQPYLTKLKGHFLLKFFCSHYRVYAFLQKVKEKILEQIA